MSEEGEVGDFEPCKNYQLFYQSLSPIYRGRRYWLVMAGVPDTFYSRTDGANDYSTISTAWFLGKLFGRRAPVAAFQTRLENPD